jgi:uncharacterized protein YuzE
MAGAAITQNSQRFAGLRATYDPLADALSLRVTSRQGRVVRTVQCTEWINADLAADGTLIGYEIIGVHSLPLPGAPQCAADDLSRA